ncbi:hypothetical protein I6J17_08140 [Heyndrickxia coagulans]|uniref:Phage protein n=1 Tax=Heyndrickxia coagulans DSM 1 = ATCC 7050 TaxID=1121088 RepID=A0A0B5X465_HEYCO|nr:hypothetical protein [Heyndrickxia coagulans]AJH78748.1 hypothetical protein BF29_2573 [Heyndrickxia coagulans DSM 1 = ATCC 7050]AJH80104.1 hypothetical protein BF29_2497 [Heyndrickxia coagulans DSM 1 = ATCC 7050]MED4535170.1 hypothetical protein [Heyndrickxia coagulans]MED4963012.1 hypothetical protein [Heyndrickxia coagulans]QJE31854.1 hypothetical protein HHU11_03855 [Heyndrickxia coagulans]
MNIYEKAEIILKSLSEYINVDDEAFHDIYIKAIVNGLVEIRKKEKQ